PRLAFAPLIWRRACRWVASWNTWIFHPGACLRQPPQPSRGLNVAVGCLHVHCSEPGSMSDTIFAKILRHEIPADIVYEDDDVVGFSDVNPQAPTHVLFIPRTPIATLDDAAPEQAELLGRLLLAAAA